MRVNREAREQWEKKQAEDAERVRKQNDVSSVRCFSLIFNLCSHKSLFNDLSRIRNACLFYWNSFTTYLPIYVMCKVLKESPSRQGISR